MSFLLDKSRRTLKCLFLALVVLFAQQAAQLHALAHAQNELAQPQKGNPLSHPAEQCLAFHAIDSALIASTALQDIGYTHSELTAWVPTEALARTVYRLPTRAPPRAV
ncbi:MAG: hypothetical protein NT123_14770 [Proteobacteria bacterium]|nr:hypothetical protein [Pseudomonadota bacterium]